MADINRTVQITGEADQLTNLIDSIGQKADETFKKLQDQARQQDITVKGQRKAMEELIKSEDQYNRKLAERNKLAVEMAAAAEKAKVDPAAEDAEERINKILEDRDRRLKEINMEYRKQKLELDEVRSKMEDVYGKDTGGSGAGGGALGAGAKGGIGMGAAVIGGATIGTLIAGIPMIGGALASMVQIAEEGEMARKRSIAMGAGRSSDAFQNMAARIGVSSTELDQLAVQAAMTRGFAGGNLRAETMGMLQVEKGFGLQQGQLMGLTQFQRFGGQNVEEIATDFFRVAHKSKLWEIDKKDFSQLGMRMEEIRNLTQEELNITGEIRQGAAMRSLARIGTIGGNFEQDSMRMYGILQGGLTGGGNDFIQAELLSAIAEMMPNKSLRQIEQIQKQGLAGEHGMEYLQAVLKRIKGSSSDVDLQKAFLSKVFPELATREVDLDALLDADISGGLGMSALSDIIGMKKDPKTGKMVPKTIQDVAQGATGGIEMANTAMLEIAKELGEAASTRLEGSLKAFGEEALEFARDPMEYFKSMVQDAADSFKDTMDEVVLGLKEATGLLNEDDETVLLKRAFGLKSGMSKEDQIKAVEGSKFAQYGEAMDIMGARNVSRREILDMALTKLGLATEKQAEAAEKQLRILNMTTGEKVKANIIANMATNPSMLWLSGIIASLGGGDD